RGKATLYCFQIEQERGSMNINVKAVHDMLDAQVRKGRTPVEAAGEGRWLADVQQEQGILSRQTRDEEIGAINEWLAAQVNVAPKELDLYTYVAELYASFVKERVRFGPNDQPIAMLDGTWREWRDDARIGHSPTRPFARRRRPPGKGRWGASVPSRGIEGAGAGDHRVVLRVRNQRPHHKDRPFSGRISQPVVLGVRPMHPPHSYLSEVLDPRGARNPGSVCRGPC